MTTRKITGSQLRGMIREALEESVVEIQLDEQIAALKAKGGRRSLQETKRYRKLLEMKMEMVDEGEQLSLGLPEPEDKGTELKGKAKFIAAKFGEGTPLGKALEDASKQSVSQRVELLSNIAEALSLDDTPGEISKVVAALKSALTAHKEEASKKQSGEAEKEALSGQLEESRRRLIRRR
jgi:hypothetical protein